MSRINTPEICTSSGWTTVPADVLLIILKKLDKKSLFNSMCVNEHWQEVVKYYCKRSKAWRCVADEASNNSYLTIREKSNLGPKGIIISALRWYNVKYAAIRLNHQYDFKGVRNICIYHGNLIVATNVGVQYYDIDSAMLIKTVDSSSVKYIETSSFIVECSPDGEKFGCNKLTVINKLHETNCTCKLPDIATYSDVTYWRIHNDYCFIMYMEDRSRRDSSYALKLLKVEKCKWILKFVKYCNQNDFCGIHMHQSELYVLYTRGNVYHVDRYDRHKMVCRFDIPLHYRSTKPYMFDTYSAMFAVSPGEKFEILFQEEEQVVVACPGLTCATEHGHMLLLGYEDGKIEIFRTTNLRKILPPEIQFNLQSYSKSITTKIIALDVYEDETCNHVFAATEYSVYQFIIRDAKSQ